MARIHSNALHKQLNIGRVIGTLRGDTPGPTLVFISGIHGNEPAGIFASVQILEKYSMLTSKLKGSIYFISGNINALEKGVRYQDQDLNRLWNPVTVQAIQNRKLYDTDAESLEQSQLYETLTTILEKESGPFYFMDLHTTSSETIPFLTVNDSMINRRYTAHYPVPAILGIEEYLDGPLLSYINSLGYVAFGFEGGQHDALSSIENHIAFITLTLAYTGAIQRSDTDFNHHYNLLARHVFGKRKVFEIDYRFEIKPWETFIMHPGFVNFQKIVKHQQLATCSGNIIRARKSGRILMPQYQQQGDDGFFTIKRTSLFFLKLSALLRRLQADSLLTFLPGVKWESAKHDTLLVNRSIARFYTKQIFHLFGYRSKVLNRNWFIMKNRELPSRAQEYR